MVRGCEEDSRRVKLEHLCLSPVEAGGAEPLNSTPPSFIPFRQHQSHPDPDIIVIINHPCCYNKDIIVLNSLALLLLCNDDCVCAGCDYWKLNFY